MSFDRFLHGDRGARVVVVPHAVAVWLASEFGAEMLKRARRADGTVEAVVNALLLARLDGSPTGTVSAPLADIAAPSTATVSTQTLADRLNFTRRTITRAIEDNRLPASKDDGGRWRISRADADRFAARARGRAA